MDELNLAELRQATNANIITAIGTWLNAKSKAEIIALLMDATEFADTPIVAYRLGGGI